jgi:hypothetical protein
METVTRLKKKTTEKEKIFDSCTSEKRIITRIHKDLKKLTPERINNQLNKWENEMKRQMSKENGQ